MSSRGPSARPKATARSKPPQPGGGAKPPGDGPPSAKPSSGGVKKPTPPHQGKPSAAAPKKPGAGKASANKPPGGPSSKASPGPSPAKRAPSARPGSKQEGGRSRDGQGSRPGSRERPPGSAASSAQEGASRQQQEELDEEVRARLAALLDSRPEPPGVDFSVEGDVEVPRDLTDEEIAEMLRQEEEERPSQVLDKGLLRSVCCPPRPGALGDSACAGGDGNLHWLTHVRLDSQRIGSVDGCPWDGMPRLANLYLQRNRLEAIPDLGAVTSLRFLTLSRNRIERISGLRDLPNLMFLDVSHNRIREIDTGELPASLRFLEMDGNPCSEGPDGDDLVIELMAVMPKLKSVDGMDVTTAERAAAKEAFFGTAIEVSVDEDGGTDLEDAEEEDGEDGDEEEQEEEEEEGDRLQQVHSDGGSGEEELTGVVSFLEDIEKQQLRELYDLSSASLRESLTNLTLLKHRITEQMSRPRSAAARAAPLNGQPPLPGLGGAPMSLARAPAEELDCRDDLHDLARELGQSMQQILDPANDPSALTKGILDGVREPLRSQANKMVDAARRRLDEEREHDRELSKAIRGIRASQSEKLQLRRAATGPDLRGGGGGGSGAPSAAAGGSSRPSSSAGRRPGTPSREALAAERLVLRSSTDPGA